MSLVMKTKRAHRGMSLSQAMKVAKKHYKKGGAEGDDAVPEVEGARRRGGGPVEDAIKVAQGATTGARRRTKRRGGGLSPLPLGGRRKTRKWRLF